MKRSTLAWFLCLLASAPVLHAAGQITNRVTYTLLEGSYFTDDCLICGRPTIQEPLRGTFDLILLQDTPPYSRYAVQNIQFTAGPGPSGQSYITGDGDYSRFEEFAVMQQMNLAVQVRDDFTNRPAYFTNDSRTVEQPFPLIQISLTQTNGTLVQTFSLELFAAPVREFWFSTSR